MSQNSILIVAIAILSALLIGAFLAITLLYDGDKAIALAGLTALAVMGFGQLAGLKVSADNSAGIAKVKDTTDDLKVAVDGRMTLLIDTVKELASAQQRLVAAQSLAHGITIGRGQVGGEVVDPPPAQPTPLLDAALGHPPAVPPVPASQPPGQVGDQY